MGLFGKRWHPGPDQEPPRGVVLHCNGRHIACDVLRDESQDRRGEAVWLAVPREPVTIAPGDSEIRVTADLLPAGTALVLDFECERFPPPDPGEMLRDVM